METNQIFSEPKVFKYSWIQEDYLETTEMETTEIAASNDTEDRHQAAKSDSDDSQSYGYRRLISDRIEHLFMAELPPDSSTFSRRILPGMFMGLDLILGPSARATFDAAADKLEVIRESDPEAAAAGRKILAIDILVTIAADFDPNECHANWFLRMVNGHLAATAADSRVVGASELSEWDLKLLLRTLCVDLRCAMGSAESRATLASRHGTDKILAVERGLDELWWPILKSRLRFRTSSTD